MQLPAHASHRKPTTESRHASTIVHPMPQPPMSRPTFLIDQSVGSLRSGIDLQDKHHIGLKSPATSVSPRPSHSQKQSAHKSTPPADHTLPRKKSGLSHVTQAEEVISSSTNGHKNSNKAVTASTWSKGTHRPAIKAGVIAPDQANVLCSSPEQVAEILNDVFSFTTLAIKRPIHPPLRSLFDSFISEDMDFGAMYARLRPHWPSLSDSITLRNNKISLERKLIEGLSSVEVMKESEKQTWKVSGSDETAVEHSFTGPSRLWDLHANRVVPSRHLSRRDGIGHPFWAVSHTRTDDMRGLDTPINNHQWLVPVPAEVSLEVVRVELLKLGAEYVWLDVLCRQAFQEGPTENTKHCEWEGQDPSIGEIIEHHAMQVVRYQNGLGRGSDGPLDPKFLRRSSGIIIPLQKTFAHQQESLVLTPEQADTKSSSPEQVLAKLNAIFGTSLDINHGSLHSRLQSLMKQDLDFGAIYARLRFCWPRDRDHIDARDDAVKLENDFVEAKRRGASDVRHRKASTGVQTINAPHSIKPRRLWDLYANRVVPYHYSYGTRQDAPVWAISHSWTDNMHHIEGRLLTSVNGREWRIPIPHGVNLDAIRTELLNLGAEYAWIDVLCIRQASSDPAKELMRKSEWMVDLPTVGAVFDRFAHRDVQYMNGLGRAFEPFGWDDDRHLLNRVWALQEAKADSVIGGIPEGIQDPHDSINVFTLERFGDRLKTLSNFEAIRSGTEMVSVHDFTRVIKAVRRMKSANPIDKVFVVAMLLCRDKLPLYRENMSAEEVWTICVENIPSNIFGVLLFKSPAPGNGVATWRPSWNQLLASGALELYNDLPFVFIPGLALSVRPDGKASYLGPVVEAHFNSNSHAGHPTGEAIIGSGFSKEVRSLKLLGNQSLPKNDYYLVGEGYELTWLVCLKTKEGFYRKVAVVTTASGTRLGEFDKKYEHCVFV